jgi:hypothetical protein
MVCSEIRSLKAGWEERVAWGWRVALWCSRRVGPGSEIGVSSCGTNGSPLGGHDTVGWV